MDRRFFLKAAGASAAVLWLGQTNAATPTLSSDPWAPWTAEALSEHADPRLRAVAHAILVPNPQNLQPWLIEFPSAERIVLRAAPDRKLLVCDYPDRQVTVGFGTFSEVLQLALEAEGFDVNIDPFPLGEPWPYLDDRPVAVFELKQGAPRRDPLLDQLLKRHTNRTPFDTSRPPTQIQLDAIRSATRWPENVYVNLEPSLAGKIHDIVLRAWDRANVEFVPTLAEVARWTKIGTAAITASPYGPNMPDAVVAKAPGTVTVNTLSDPTSAIAQAMRTNYRRAVESGQAHIWIASPDYDRKGAFNAGRDWVRAHLKATELGLDMQPHSQPLFDFAEIMPFVRELHDTVGVATPGRIQMLGRIGHGTSVGPSQRATAISHLVASR